MVEKLKQKNKKEDDLYEEEDIILEKEIKDLEKEIYMFIEKIKIELINKISHQKELIKIDDYNINQKIININKNKINNNENNIKK